MESRKSGKTINRPNPIGEQIKMLPANHQIDTTHFNVSAGNSCVASKIAPEQKAIRTILASAKKKPLQADTIIIARFEWLKRNKLSLPQGMELPNLCLTIKNGKLARAFYSNVLTHIIKKQRYFIQILN